MCHFMRQIIFIGFSTTGKSTLINKIADKFPNRIKFDTDKIIAKDFGDSIANIYYGNKNLADTHKFIEGQESDVLFELANTADNLVIAAGPGIPFRSAFPTYIQSKQPHVVLIERPADEIYKSLLDRRNKMKTDTEHQRPDFGIWDIGVMIDDKLNDYPIEIAIQKIQSLLDQRQESYNKYSTLKINSSGHFQRLTSKILAGHPIKMAHNSALAQVGLTWLLELMSFSNPYLGRTIKHSKSRPAPVRGPLCPTRDVQIHRAK